MLTHLTFRTPRLGLLTPRQLISRWLADATIGRLQSIFNGTFTQPPANHIDSPRQQVHTTDPHRHDGAPSSISPKTPTTHTATTSRQDSPNNSVSPHINPHIKPRMVIISVHFTGSQIYTNTIPTKLERTKMENMETICPLVNQPSFALRACRANENKLHNCGLVSSLTNARTKSRIHDCELPSTLLRGS
ncbi:hypothetical protein Pcinc_005140 [Petrolisthes cinctipes]|uniref:Uncharacterized protein n=1 Tax=Petrolisthes cinctipes TaxID=88211 RepID=A0AAE1GK41_PETCI|nr:hypothetical protein Pcinc_005140 [Petrolisthes cinctipes]